MDKRHFSQTRLFSDSESLSYFHTIEYDGSILPYSLAAYYKHTAGLTCCLNLNSS